MPEPAVSGAARSSGLRATGCGWSRPYPGVLSMSAGVHGYFLGGFDCLGPGVRVPAGDAGRASQQVSDRYREMPRRRMSFHLSGNHHSGSGRARACSVRSHSHPHRNRRAPAAFLHAYRARRNDGGPDNADAGVHGADSDAGNAAVLPAGGALPASRAARLAGRAHPGSTRSPTSCIPCGTRSSVTGASRRPRTRRSRRPSPGPGGRCPSAGRWAPSQ